MVMKPEPVVRGLEAVQGMGDARARVVLLSPQGQLFNQKLARQFSRLPRLILVCGKYEGVDDRVVGSWPMRQRGQDRLDLRGEDECLIRQRVVERLDVESVARAEQPTPALVPQRERPHAVEPLDAVDTPLLVGVEDDFRVGVGVEGVAELSQRVA